MKKQIKNTKTQLKSLINNDCMACNEHVINKVAPFCPKHAICPNCLNREKAEIIEALGECGLCNHVRGESFY